jgi:hypothetical protein
VASREAAEDAVAMAMDVSSGWLPLELSHVQQTRQQCGWLIHRSTNFFTRTVMVLTLFAPSLTECMLDWADSVHHALGGPRF